MRRGLATSSALGARERDSRTPGRKGSMRTSALVSRVSRRARALGDLRFKAMEDLRRVRRSVVGGGGEEVWAWGWGRSMRRMEAP